MTLASFKIFIDQSGDFLLPDELPGFCEDLQKRIIEKFGNDIQELKEFCRRLQAGSYYIQLRDDAPESRWTMLMRNSIHGDMDVLSAATDHNVSAHEWKVTCKMMRPDLFVYKSSIRNPITNAMPEILRSLSDPELSRKDILSWMETYRRNMESVWYHGNLKIVPPVKPLKEIYDHTPVLYWYTRFDQQLRELAEKEKR